MGTLTTRLGLFKPATIDDVDVAIDLNDNLDKLDVAAGTHVCTSTTRPTGTNLWAGRTIFETDTLRSNVYTGTEWVCIRGEKVVRRLATDVKSPTSGAVGATETALQTLTFDVRATYKYSALWCMKTAQTSGGAFYIARLRKTNLAGAVYNDTGVECARAVVSLTTPLAHVWTAATTETIAMVLSLELASGSGTIQLQANSTALVDEIS